MHDISKGRDPSEWIARSMGKFESSGIRKVFDLARKLKNPVNLSIGQPDFEVPAPIRHAAARAIEAGHNSYTVTQGMAELREGILARVRASLPTAACADMSTSSATRAPCWAMLGAQTKVNCCSLIISSISRAGP